MEVQVTQVSLGSNNPETNVIRPEGEVPAEQKIHLDWGAVGVTNVAVESSSVLEIGGRKRKATLEVGGSSHEGGPSAPKQARLEPAGEDAVIKCAVCDREFPSWKSLFGHMRSHPERPWRGAFPPPAFNPAEGALEFDLNVAAEPSLPLPPPPPQSPSPPPPSPSPPPPPSPNRNDGGAPGADFDLNLPPPEE